MPVTSQSAFRSFLYGGGAALLAFDLFFLIKAAFTSEFIPIVPILAGIFTAIGLLVVVFAEHQAREADKQDHRRISRVAHQLEMPLTALREDFELILKDAESLPPSSRLKLKRMETKTHIVLENVRDVFLMLQAQEGPISHDARVYDLCVLVHDVIEKERPLYSARNVELITQNHCTNAPAKVDRKLFMLALTHVLENARLYTLKPGLVNVLIMRGKNKIRIVVQDRGVGVAARDKGVIWQPFARGAQADQFDADGIGVGLTLSRLIIRELGGDIIWKNRTDSSGAQFEIHLPLSKK